VAPEDNKRNVFNNGSLKGENASMPAGGHIAPII